MVHQLLVSILPFASLLAPAVQPVPPPAAAAANLRPAQVLRAPMVSMSAGDDQWTSADDAGLRRRLEEATTTHLGSPDFVMNLSRNQALDSVYVLIFNPGQTDEGVYTLQGKSMRAGAYVLAFEQDDDAHRFSELLQVRARAPFCCGTHLWVCVTHVPVRAWHRARGARSHRGTRHASSCIPRATARRRHRATG